MSTILVTNDDGDSEGLRLLLGVARRFGTAHAIAPNRQRSAVSGALTLHKPLRLHRIDTDVHSVNGTPSDCVLFGLHSGEFGRPDLVLSGINWGDNSGMGSLLGSGTVGACWQAALEGIPSIAFSMTKGSGDWRDSRSWGDRTLLAERVAGIIALLKPKLGKERFFNVNMPFDVKGAKVVHVRKMQRERYGTRIEKRVDPEGRPYYWIIGSSLKPVRGTDVYEVMVKGNIAVTEIALSVFDER